MRYRRAGIGERKWKSEFVPTNMPTEEFNSEGDADFHILSVAKKAMDQIIGKSVRM